jgi:hypothetical protein
MFPISAGLIGSVTVLTAKAAYVHLTVLELLRGSHAMCVCINSGELIKTTAKGDSQFDHPATYLIVLTAIVTAVLQVC